MLDQQDGHLGAELLNQLENALGLHRPGTRHGLVQQQEFGLGGHGQAQLQNALLAVREFTGRILRTVLQTQLVQHGHGLRRQGLF